MANLYRRRGRKPLIAARIVELLRQNHQQSVPVTVSLLRKALPDVRYTNLFRALDWLREHAGLLVRSVPGTTVREYQLGTQHQRWGYSLDPEQVRTCARAENTLLLILSEWRAAQ